MNARITRSLVAVVAAAAVAAVGVAALGSSASAGSTGSSTDTGAASGTSATVISAVVTSKDHGRTDFGFIAGSFTANGARYLRFDRAIFLTGAAAAAAKAAHGIDPSEPPDYYIQNDNRRLRTYALAANVQVYGSQVLTGSPAVKPVTLQKLVDHLRTRPAGSTYPPFVLTFSKGKVVKIVEQYVA